MIRSQYRNRHIRYYVFRILVGLAAVVFGGAGLYSEVLTLTGGTFEWSLVNCIVLLLIAGMLAGGLWGLVVCVFRISSLERGRLGRSMRTQLESMGAQTVRDLMDEMDADLSAHSRRFGKVLVGETWVLGDEAMKLERIRGIFPLEVRTAKGGRDCSLCLVDCEGNVQTTSMALPDDLRAVCDYLHARFPGAAMGDMSEYTQFLALDEEGKRALEQSYLLMQASRKQEQARGMGEAFAFADADGIPTSHVRWETIESALDTLAPGRSVRLSLLIPIPLEDGSPAEQLVCEREETGDTYHLYLYYTTPTGTERAVRSMPQAEARELLSRCFYKRRLPDIHAWTIQVWSPAREEEHFVLFVDQDEYENNTFEDVDAALDGVEAGTYRSFFLMRRSGDGGYLALVEKDGASYIIEAALPDEDGEDFFFSKATQRKDQVRFWFSNFYMYSEHPDVSDWDDITRQVKKRRSKSER